jgi:hypothetical protein
VARKSESLEKETKNTKEKSRDVAPSAGKTSVTECLKFKGISREVELGQLLHNSYIASKLLPDPDKTPKLSG